MGDGDHSRVPRKYRSSMGASILAAGLIGLRDVIDPARVEDRTETEAPAPEPSAAADLDVHLDPDDPAASVVVLHPVAGRTRLTD